MYKCTPKDWICKHLAHIVLRVLRYLISSSSSRINALYPQQGITKWPPRSTHGQLLPQGRGDALHTSRGSRGRRPQLPWGNDLRLKDSQLSRIPKDPTPHNYKMTKWPSVKWHFYNQELFLKNLPPVIIGILCSTGVWNPLLFWMKQVPNKASNRAYEVSAFKFANSFPPKNKKKLNSSHFCWEVSITTQKKPPVFGGVFQPRQPHRVPPLVRPPPPVALKNPAAPLAHLKPLTSMVPAAPKKPHLDVPGTLGAMVVWKRGL